MTDRDIDAIRDLGARMAEAERSFDAASLEGTLADDVVIMPPNIPAMKGKQACLPFIRATLSDLQQRFERQTFRHISDEIVVAGDVAFDRGTYEISLLPKTGGDLEEERGQYLRVFSRGSGGAWQASRLIWNIIFPPEADAERGDC